MLSIDKKYIENIENINKYKNDTLYNYFYEGFSRFDKIKSKYTVSIEHYYKQPYLRVSYSSDSLILPIESLSVNRINTDENFISSIIEESFYESEEIINAINILNNLDFEEYKKIFINSKQGELISCPGIESEVLYFLVSHLK